jgi:hypothetical protein
MVFVSNGGTEEGKDAVAGGLHDEALIAVDGVHHELEGGVNNESRLLRVEVFDEGSGVLDIGKEGGDRLALTIRTAPRFQRRLFGPDAFGEVGWRITSRRLGG